MSIKTTRENWRLAKKIASRPASKHKSRPAKKKPKETYRRRLGESRKERYSRWVRLSPRWKEIKAAYFKTCAYKDCEICDESKGINVHHRITIAYWLFGPSAFSAVFWAIIKHIPPIRWPLLRLCFIMLCSNHHNALHKWAKQYHIPLFPASLMYVHIARMTNLLRALKQLGSIAFQLIVFAAIIWFAMFKWRGF